MHFQFLTIIKYNNFLKLEKGHKTLKIKANNYCHRDIFFKLKRMIVQKLIAGSRPTEITQIAYFIGGGGTYFCSIFLTLSLKMQHLKLKKCVVMCWCEQHNG